MLHTPGRKQEGGSPRFPAPPTSRPQPGSGLRKLRAQFPAAPLLRGSRVLDFQDARRGGGAALGFPGSGRWGCAGSRPGLASGSGPECSASCRCWRGAKASGNGSGATEGPLPLPPGPAGKLLEPGRGGPGWVRSVGPWKLRPKSGGKRGVGPHKPPKVKDCLIVAYYDKHKGKVKLSTISRN